MKQTYKKYCWPVAYLLICLGIIFVVVPDLAVFKESETKLLAAMRTADMWLSVLTLTAAAFCAAGIYMSLVPRRLRFGEAALVQLAGSFINRVLPAGVGAVSISYLYLRRSKLSATSAAAVVTTNNTLGTVGNALLLVVCLLVSPGLLLRSSRLTVAVETLYLWLGLFFLALCGILILLHTRAKRLMENYAKELLKLLSAPKATLMALSLSIALSFLHAFHIWLACQAVGLDISMGVAVVVMSLRAVAAAITPAPGGLGGIELATTSLLILYGAAPAVALSAALLTRVVIYVSCFGFGLPSLLYIRARRLI